MLLHVRPQVQVQLGSAVLGHRICCVAIVHSEQMHRILPRLPAAVVYSHDIGPALKVVLQCLRAPALPHVDNLVLAMGW
jgi:hypothetical protein